MVDIVTSTGALSGWNVGQQAYTVHLQVAGTPSSIAASPDGHYLVIGNKDGVTLNGIPSNLLTRVDTGALSTTQIYEPQNGQTFGVARVTITADGAALFNSDAYLTGANGFQQFQVASTTPTPAPVAALAALNPASSFIASEDHRYVLLEGATSSQGAMALYDSASGHVVASNNLTSIGGGDAGRGDISSAGGLVVDLTYSNILVLDMGLHLVKNLSSYQLGGSVVGAAFSDDGHQLFLWEGAQKTIAVLDTQTWQQVGTLAVSGASSLSSFDLSTGEMDVVSHGQVLVLDKGSGLELVDVASRLHLNLVGDATDQKLFGSVGADSLSGGGGSDTLHGGLGADVLTGGTGVDLFAIAPGDSPAVAGQGDVITDWQASDNLSFGGAAGSAGNFVATTAGSFSAALATANQQIASGAADYVAVAVGADVVVFADSHGDNGVADDAVTLTGRGLSDISASNVVGAAAAPIAEPGLPPPPVINTTGAHASIQGNMDAAHLSHLIGADIDVDSPTELRLTGAGALSLDMTGTGFTYDLNDQFTGGTVKNIAFTDAVGSVTTMQANVSLNGISAVQFGLWAVTDDNQTAFQTILGGSDMVNGGNFRPDLIHSYGGDDLLYGLGGGDTLFGGDGNDVIFAGSPTFPALNPDQTYLRGEAGDDYIIGGAGFDDANGNMGNDTISTGAGDDYSVGGKDNDLLFGDDGVDIVWGNLGNDTCVGGNGDDQVRGGQGDDLVFGGAGNDYVSGDRGSDTITGGAGADLFHTFSGAGIDRVLDFHLSEGDRVMLDPGTVYAVNQVGSDTVIDMGNGDQMILVGVQMSTLTQGWIFGA